MTALAALRDADLVDERQHEGNAPAARSGDAGPDLRTAEHTLVLDRDFRGAVHPAEAHGETAAGRVQHRIRAGLRNGKRQVLGRLRGQEDPFGMRPYEASNVREGGRISRKRTHRRRARLANHVQTFPRSWDAKRGPAQRLGLEPPTVESAPEPCLGRYDWAMTQARKLAFTAALFAAALALVVASAATRAVAPLFVAWLPLVAVAWVLIRPEPGPAASDSDPPEQEAEHSPSPDAPDDKTL